MMTRPLASTLTLIAGLALASSAIAQAKAPPAAATPSTSTATTTNTIVQSSGDPRRDTIARMGKLMSLEVSESRLEDIMTFIKETTQAELEIIWQGEGDATPGLDKEKKLTLNIKNRPALAILETVLEKAKGDFGTGNQWQMTTYGAMQIGPKEALNKHRRVEMYDINDLLTTIPRYTDVPEIDLNSVLQQSQGGGGGTSPFRQQNQQQAPDKPREDRAKDIVDILTTNVEPDQWTDNGGESSTIRHYNGTLIVNAPDYVHRGINGYTYWSNYSSAKNSSGHRWLTLNADTGAAKINGFGNAPVSAVVGGRVVGSAGGGGVQAPPPGKR